MVFPLLIRSKLLQTRHTTIPHTFCRYKSITAAIERGRHGPGRVSRSRTRESFYFGPTRAPRRGKWFAHPRVKDGDAPQVQDERSSAPREKDGDAPQVQDITGREGLYFGRIRGTFGDTAPAWEITEGMPLKWFGKDQPRPTVYPNGEPRYVPRPLNKSNERLDPKGLRDIDPEKFADTRAGSVREPKSLPYSTAASEFIYGHSSVIAATKANRRKLYTLYVHTRGTSRSFMAHIRENKLFSITKEVGDEYIRAMDKASSGRPHNGVILEASALPVPPITELKTTSIEDASFRVSIDSQTVEDADINGSQEIYSYRSAGWRQPLILYVDGVLDEGNLGAIARSAYFLGADAVITPTRQSAPWSHIAVKASAGAAEALPLFEVREPIDFLGKSSRAGWRIYASAAIPRAPSTSASTGEDQDERTSKVVYTIARSPKRLPTDHCPVAEHPTILMMGAEGTGLRTGLQNLAHYNIGIQCSREVDEVGVDSLNVSAAASLLCYEMLQKPKRPPPVDEAENRLF